MKKPDLTAVRQDALAFPDYFQSVQIATCDQDGNPDISYAPFLRQQDRFYIFVSDTVTRTRNLEGNPKGSLLFIENEEACANLFARKRLTLSCTARLIDLDSADYARPVAGLLDKFGRQVQNLTELADFHLFEFTPVKGLFVTGFGRAFELTGENLSQIRHITGSGHRRRDGREVSELAHAS